MDEQLFGKCLKMLVNRGHFEMKMLFFDISTLIWTLPFAVAFSPVHGDELNLLN